MATTTDRVSVSVGEGTLVVKVGGQGAEMEERVPAEEGGHGGSWRKHHEFANGDKTLSAI